MRKKKESKYSACTILQKKKIDRMQSLDKILWRVLWKLLNNKFKL